MNSYQRGASDWRKLRPSFPHPTLPPTAVSDYYSDNPLAYASRAAACDSPLLCCVHHVPYWILRFCKSFELNRLHVNLPSNIGRVSARNIYTPNKLHKERLICFFVVFVFVFLCPVNLCLNSKRLICGVDGLHGGFSTLRSWASAFRLVSGTMCRLPQVCWALFSVKRMCFYTPGFDHQGSIAALASRISI